jgi:TolB protein
MDLCIKMTNKILTLILTTLGVAFSQEPTFIQIQSDSLKPSIAIETLQGDLGKDASQILSFDLSIAGRYNIVNIAKTDSLSLFNSHAQSLIQGSIQNNSGQIQIDLKVIDVYSKTSILDYKKSTSLTLFRKAIHALSDSLIFMFSGEKGIAQTQIAWTSRQKNQREIMVGDYDGASPQKITHDGSIAMLPDWTPDNKNIIYTSFKEGYASLWAVNVATSTTKRVTAPGLQTFGGRISPGGQSLVYTQQNEDGSDIYKKDMNSNRIERLTNHPTSETSAEWSPNSYNIAFTSNRSGNPQIYSMDADGGNETRISKMGRYVESPSWSPKGDKIAFCQMDGNSMNIYSMDADGSNVVQLTQNQGSNENPSWSPDGRLIIFSSTRTGVSQIFMMRADGSEQEQITKVGINSSPRWSKQNQQNNQQHDQIN